MRKKVPKLVISFKAVTAAIAMENIAKSELGRIIPLPAAIGAGCGLAFCVNPKDEKEILALMEKHDIEYSGLHTVEIYEARS
ncbi:MAG: DUF3343 domain-containing protein [Clostridiales bacterium]|jgi:hypothetical protein|nr:DUF3343 domain-containing protein [Clostridiales bacterium]